VVLVDEAAESVAALDLARRRGLPSLVGLGWPEFERSVRSLAVVMLDVDTKHAFEVTAVGAPRPRWPSVLARAS
jgi:hypothetical protein